MEGLPIGKQLQFLSNQGDISNRSPIPEIKNKISVGDRKPEMAGKYALIGKYLSSLPVGQHEVTLTFSQIEKVLNDKLPSSAQRYRAWWSNEIEGSHSQARAWLNTGCRVDTVNFTQKWVRFLHV